MSSLYLCDRIDCPGWMGSLSKNVIFVTNTYLEGEGQRALYRPYLYQHRLWQFVVVLSAVNSGILTAKVRFELIVMCDCSVVQISTFIGKTCSITPQVRPSMRGSFSTLVPVTDRRGSPSLFRSKSCLCIYYTNTAEDRKEEALL